MEVRVAKSAGFCFGVKRAVNTVYAQLDSGQHIFTYGPIIHNETVVEDLQAKGVEVLQDVPVIGQSEGTQQNNGKQPQIPERPATPQPQQTINPDKADGDNNVIIIRSHGIPKATHDAMLATGATVIDATCPFVKKIHNIVAKKEQEGYEILIIGNPSHPEVEGIKGWCEKEAVVVENESQVETFFRELEIRHKKDEENRNSTTENAAKNPRICIVSQTTFNLNKFEELVEIICKKGYDVNVVNTICNATEERQREAAEIADTVDAMIVIGGTHSSNSRKLYEICRRRCENTYFIQTLEDLALHLPAGAKLVGITAGASTPNNIIEEVQNYVRINF